MIVVIYAMAMVCSFVWWDAVICDVICLKCFSFFSYLGWVCCLVFHSSFLFAWLLAWLVDHFNVFSPLLLLSAAVLVAIVVNVVFGHYLVAFIYFRFEINFVFVWGFSCYCCLVFSLPPYTHSWFPVVTLMNKYEKKK